MNDPCDFCRHYYKEPMDMDTGYVDCGCDIEEEFEGCEYGKPCPSFAPRLVSDDLLEILWNEDQYRQYLEEKQEEEERMRFLEKE